MTDWRSEPEGKKSVMKGPPELRVDVSDGNKYSLDSFIEAYGGTRQQPPKQWSSAPKNVSPPKQIAKKAVVTKAAAPKPKAEKKADPAPAPAQDDDGDDDSWDNQADDGGDAATTAPVKEAPKKAEPKKEPKKKQPKTAEPATEKKDEGASKDAAKKSGGGGGGGSKQEVADAKASAEAVEEAKKQAAEFQKLDAREHVNIIFIGHVDAGKSTIGGHLMFLTGGVDKRTLEKYEREAREANRESWYLSWALDTNDEERAKGKTVECGRASFATEKKMFTIIDAPGHKSFVPSMISGSVQADIATLVCFILGVFL